MNESKIKNQKSKIVKNDLLIKLKNHFLNTLKILFQLKI